MEHILERKERSLEFESNLDLCVERKRVDYARIHAHNYFELEIFIGGHGMESLNGENYAIGRGYVCLMGPSDFHEIHAGSNVELWNISFSETMIPPECLNALYSGTNMRRRKMEEEELSILHTAAKLLFTEYKENGYTQPLMEYLLKRIIGSFHSNQTDSPIYKAVQYIEMHFREDPSLADVAKQACLSPVYFGNLFKQHIGMTYVKYLNQRKVICAKMLLESGMSVTDACYSAGFGSMSGFLHSFKQITGMTPKDYKASCK